MTAWNQRKAAAVLAVGVLFGGIGTVALMHGPAKAEAQAQADAKPSVPGRYQVSSFAYGYGYSGPNATNFQSKWGAYIVDTATGDLFISIENGKPHSIGRVGDK